MGLSLILSLININMKKLLLLLTTFTLTGGSFASLNNFSQQNTHFTEATNENKAQQISDKIQNSIVKLDPNFWLNKNIEIYQNQLNATLVKEGILTQAEAGVNILWSNVTINKAVSYKVNFEVVCQWSAAGGTTQLNASTGETAYQIGQKLESALPIHLKYSNVPLQNHLPELRQALVAQKILTIPEASLVAGVTKVPRPAPGIRFQPIIVNDGNTTFQALCWIDYTV